MRRVSGCPHLADRLRVAVPQPGIAADAAAASRGLQAGLGALGDQSPLELGDGAQNLQGEHALRRGGVDGIAQAAEMGAVGFELLDDGQQVAHRTGKPVQADDDPGFCRTGCHATAGPARAGCGQHRRRAPPTRSRSLRRKAHRAADWYPGLRWRPWNSRSVGQSGHFCWFLPPPCPNPVGATVFYKQTRYVQTAVCRGGQGIWPACWDGRGGADDATNHRVIANLEAFYCDVQVDLARFETWMRASAAR